MRQEQHSLNVPVVAAAGTAKPVSHLQYEKTVQVDGTFTATVNLEASIDGINYIVVQAGLATGVFHQILGHYKFIRCSTTAYTTGTPIVLLSGVTHE